ncbi:hypothetical protein CRYUN_Cryun15aG0065600 [Craigia yunnanensis]
MTIVSAGLFKDSTRCFKSNSIVGVDLGGTLAYRHTYKINRVRFSSSIPSSYYCCATLSITMEEAKQTFDVDKAAVLVNKLRKTFSSGKTKSYEWRMSQLESISKMIDGKEKEIIKALHKDLSKPELEAFLSEISMTKSSCKLALKELKHWMMPKKHFSGRNFNGNLNIVGRNCVRTSWSCLGHIYLELPFLYVIFMLF